MGASLPARKRLWQAIIKAKIAEQAVRLGQPYQCRMMRLSQCVKSGDHDNIEAQAARIYWAARFPEQYDRGDKRDPESNSFFNSALNYGYAIVRAATARALVSAGMQPALGVFHHGRSNPFCLADDVMEPLRPMVDDCVHAMLRESPSPDQGLEQRHRRQLLSLLSAEVVCQSFKGPLLVALSRYANNVFNVLTEEQSLLFPPQLCSSTDTDACG
jgi:CRISPR-associated protein Cas1